MSVEELYNMTQANYDAIFNRHVKEFRKAILTESKKGQFEANLYARDFEDGCYEPLQVVFDAIKHIETLFTGIKIKLIDDHHIIGDGYHFEANWDIKAIALAEQAELDEYADEPAKCTAEDPAKCREAEITEL